MISLKEIYKDVLETNKMNDNRFIVWHGSKSKFDKFDKQKINNHSLFGYGFYFSESKKVAQTEGGNILYKCMIFKKSDDYLDIRELNRRLSSNYVKRFKIGLQKLGIQANFALENYPIKQILENFLVSKFDSPKEMSDFLYSLGFHGLRIKNQFGSSNFLVFNDNDIDIMDA